LPKLTVALPIECQRDDFNGLRWQVVEEFHLMKT